MGRGYPSCRRRPAGVSRRMGGATIQRMVKKNLATPKNYEEAERELQQIVADIESGEISLEESLAKYERGTFLLEYCRGVLSSAEKQIESLTRGPDGRLVAPASDEEASA